MAEKPSTKRSLTERLSDHELIERALRQAVREALRQHKLAGNPVAVSEGGRVVLLPPEEIPLEDEA